MKKSIIRLGLVAGVALAATIPVAPAHAFYCPPPVVSTVCAVYGAVCGLIPDSPKDNVHELLCESFA